MVWDGLGWFIYTMTLSGLVKASQSHLPCAPLGWQFPSRFRKRLFLALERKFLSEPFRERDHPS